MTIIDRYARAVRAIHPRLATTVRAHSADPARPVVWLTYHLAEGMDLRLAALSELDEFPSGPGWWLREFLDRLGWRAMVASARDAYGAMVHPALRLGLDRATPLTPRP